MRPALVAGCVLAAAFAPSLPIARNRKDPADVPLAPARVHDVVARGTLAFVGQTGALVVHDLSDPANPRVLGRLGRPGQVLGVALDGERAYLAGGSFGAAVVDVSSPEAPVLLGRYDTPGSVRRIAVRDGIAALADDIRGLEIVSFADPTKPHGLASIPSRDKVRGVAWRGALLATAEESAGVRLFDVTLAGSPRRLPPIEKPRPALDVALCDGGLLLVAAGDTGLAVWDVGDPSRPRAAASVPMPGRARSVACSGGIAVVGCGDRGVAIVDLSQAGAPRRISTMALGRGHPAERVWLLGDFVLAAAEAGGLGVVSIADPASPVVLVPRERRMRITFP